MKDNTNMQVEEENLKIRIPHKARSCKILKIKIKNLIKKINN